ncbi:metallophosphoesterase [Robertmurraya sp.]|uniref:metallophosphoesterase n=1 Tax=Robertmurraya sp. TaxID=2837525 RepID=UPI003704265F
MKAAMYSRLVLTIILYSVFTFYISWNVHLWLQSTFSVNILGLVIAVIFLLSYSYVLARFFKKLLILKYIGSYWFGIIQYTLLLLPIADFIGWLFIFAGFSSDSVIFWVGTIVLLVMISILGLGTFNAYNPVIREHEIEIDKEAPFSSLRVVMASDMHFGHLSGKTHANRLVHEVNSLQPDLILLPGDIIDDDPEPFIQKGFGSIMEKLSARYGVYGILGNHEYYGGGIPMYIKEMQRIGIPILMDETVVLEGGIQVVGRKDKTDRNRKNIEKLLESLDETKPIFIMDHQPLELVQAAEHGADLMLSGHTHRGQMAPNHLITRRIFELDWGYLKKNQLHAFVSSGFGFWGPPLRIGSRSEILLIDITFTKNSLRT